MRYFQFNLPVAELALGAPLPFCVCMCMCWEVADVGWGDKLGAGIPSLLLQGTSGSPSWVAADC